MATTTGATNNTAAACNASCGSLTAQRDVFYSFTLTQPELVYADTFGASYDTLLFFQDSAGMNVAGATACTTRGPCLP